MITHPTVRRRPGPFISTVNVLLVVVIGGLLVSCFVTLAIWPGEVKLVAPLFCSDAQPDAFVVADTYRPAPGETSINFSLYCMGEHGDATDHGFLRPFLVVSMLNGIALLALLVIVVRWRRRSRSTQHVNDSARGLHPTQE